MAKVVVMDHPLIQHKIGFIRRRTTGTKSFRETVGEIAMLLCYEATRDLELEDVEIDTPIAHMTAKQLKGKKLAVVATGGSSVDAVALLKQHGCRKIHFLCIIAAPEGVKAFTQAHPDVDLYIGALDDHLNENGYIVPGLGDAGDRIFGTK